VDRVLRRIARLSDHLFIVLVVAIAA